MAPKQRPLWLIYSREHNAWWRGGRDGYTPHVNEAGRYTWAEALEICDQANRDAGPGGGVNEFTLPALSVWPGPEHQPEETLTPGGKVFR